MPTTSSSSRAPLSSTSAASHGRWVLLCFSVAALAGCGNYRFRNALDADGRYDIATLKAALKEAEEGRLEESFWVPLVAWQSKSFVTNPPAREPPESSGRQAASHDMALSLAGGPDYPAGHRLSEGRAYGPLFAISQFRRFHFDASEKLFEVNETSTILWRLWSRRRSLVITPYGTREENRQSLFFGIFPLTSRIKYYPFPPDERWLW